MYRVSKTVLHLYRGINQPQKISCPNPEFLLFHITNSALPEHLQEYFHPRLSTSPLYFHHETVLNPFC